MLRGLIYIPAGTYLVRLAYRALTDDNSWGSENADGTRGPIGRWERVGVVSLFGVTGACLVATGIFSLVDALR